MNTIISNIHKEPILKDIRLELVLRGHIKNKIKKVLPFWLYKIIMKVGPLNKNVILLEFAKNIQQYIPTFQNIVEDEIIIKLKKPILKINTISKYTNIYKSICELYPISIHILVKPLLIKIWDIELNNFQVNKCVLDIGTDLIAEHFNANTFITLKTSFVIAAIKRKSYGALLSTIACESIIDAVMSNGIYGFENFVGERINDCCSYYYDSSNVISNDFLDNDTNPRFGRHKDGYTVKDIEILNSFKPDYERLLYFVSVTKSLLNSDNFLAMLSFFVDNDLIPCHILLFFSLYKKDCILSNLEAYITRMYTQISAKYEQPILRILESNPGRYYIEIDNTYYSVKKVKFLINLLDKQTIDIKTVFSISNYDKLRALLK